MKKEKETVEAVETPVAVEPVFTLEQLRPDCRALFGVSASTFDGATAALSGEYTVEQVRTHINNWLKEVY